jgi:hypothetical protein
MDEAPVLRPSKARKQGGMPQASLSTKAARHASPQICEKPKKPETARYRSFRANPGLNISFALFRLLQDVKQSLAASRR